MKNYIVLDKITKFGIAVAIIGLVSVHGALVAYWLSTWYSYGSMPRAHSTPRPRGNFQYIVDLTVTYPAVAFIISILAIFFIAPSIIAKKNLGRTLIPVSWALCAILSLLLTWVIDPFGMMKWSVD